MHSCQRFLEELLLKCGREAVEGKEATKQHEALAFRLQVGSRGTRAQYEAFSGFAHFEALKLLLASTLECVGPAVAKE